MGEYPPAKGKGKWDGWDAGMDYASMKGKGKWLAAMSGYDPTWFDDGWGGKSGWYDGGWDDSSWGDDDSAWGWAEDGKASWKGAGKNGGKEKSKSKGAGEVDEDHWYTGIIRSYAKEKGFGFITGSEFGDDVYVHTNVVEKCGGYNDCKVQFKIHVSAQGKPQA